VVVFLEEPNVFFLYVVTYGNMNSIETSTALSSSAMQQQITQSLLSEMSVAAGSLMTTGNETVGQNSFIRETATLGQISVLVPALTTPIPSSTLNTMTFEQTILPTTTTAIAQQEREVVNELQEILDQSSQQSSMMGMSNDTKPNIMGPTSFIGQTISLEQTTATSPYQSTVATTVTSPASHHSTSPRTLFGESAQHSSPPTTLFGQTIIQHSSPPPAIFNETVQQLSPVNVNPFTTASNLAGGVSMTCVQGQVGTMTGDVLVQNIDTNMGPGSLICTTSETVTGGNPCMSETMMKTEPSSPVLQSSCQGGQVTSEQVQPVVTQTVMNLMEGVLGGTQSSLTNAFTQLSDNELLNYINPSCFDQGSF